MAGEIHTNFVMHDKWNQNVFNAVKTPWIPCLLSATYLNDHWILQIRITSLK